MCMSVCAAGTIQSLQDVYFRVPYVLDAVQNSIKPLPGAAVFICKRALFPTTERFHMDKRSPFVFLWFCLAQQALTSCHPPPLSEVPCILTVSIVFGYIICTTRYSNHRTFIIQAFT